MGSLYFDVAQFAQAQAIFSLLCARPEFDNVEFCAIDSVAVVLADKAQWKEAMRAQRAADMMTPGRPPAFKL